MIFKPKFKLNVVTDIRPDFLIENGIKALILDVDNTLSTHHGQQLTNGLEEWISLMQQKNIKLTVLSNSKEKRVEPFAKKIGLDYISLGLKPLPFGYLRAIKKLNVKKSEAAIVGDQIFTDVLGGNLIGLKTILLTPILPENGWSFKLRRRMEKILLKIYKM